ncbi:MAG: tRNA epoxyqueuosine(34) reductase QueG [Prolixibacteraceae bacterium]|nr:tRNA epoxyqueuosine(34) reductase QueG [Prolixibacteraceae bacterium]
MGQQYDISEKIKNQAKILGFTECAIIAADSLKEEQERFRYWIESGMHGEMNYMSRNMEKRLDPGLLLENAKSIIIVLLNYFTNRKQSDPEAPVISKYALGQDYHKVIKNKLRELLQFIREKEKPCQGRPFVDSAPVLERALARKAGLGWTGKNSNLISEKYGSFFFIGELIVDIELTYDKVDSVVDHCGSCTRCIDACPTNAIIKPRVVDARKCISYQTIEVKGDLDENLKGLFQNRVFGCDICQDVCPWNKRAPLHEEPAFNPHPRLPELNKKEWYAMDEKIFNDIFKGSAVERAGFKGIKRNLKFIEDTEL